MSRFTSGKAVVAFPVVVSLVLALVAGGLQTISQVALTHHPEWQGIIAVFLVFVVAEGIDPLNGAAFVAALHLPSWATRLVNALIAALAGVLQVIPLSTGVHIAVADTLTIFAALGFGTLVPPMPRPVASAAVLK